MAKVELTLGNGYSLIDVEDIPLVEGRRWRLHSGGYAVWGTRKDGISRFEFMHRVITGAGPGEVVDHINGDRLDNRRSNLRLCDHAQNAWNTSMHRDNTYGVKGVEQQSSGKFTARIYVRGKKIWLGTFSTVEEAAQAYDEAALKYFGEFANTNESNS